MESWRCAKIMEHNCSVLELVVALQLVAVRRITNNDVLTIISVLIIVFSLSFFSRFLPFFYPVSFCHTESAWNKESGRWSKISKNPVVALFPEPVGHFDAPLWTFWRQCNVASCEWVQNVKNGSKFNWAKVWQID